jgi:cytochrome c551/c552
MLKQIGFLLLAVLISCHTIKKQGPSPERIQLTKTEKKKGLDLFQLIETKDCPTCHTIDTKYIGPPFISVSRKYEVTDENINRLSLKIINGGIGVWGDVPMTPHTTLTRVEAKEIVTLILTLKNQQ